MKDDYFRGMGDVRFTAERFVYNETLKTIHIDKIMESMKHDMVRVLCEPIGKKLAIVEDKAGSDQHQTAFRAELYVFTPMELRALIDNVKQHTLDTVLSLQDS